MKRITLILLYVALVAGFAPGAQAAVPHNHDTDETLVDSVAEADSMVPFDSPQYNRWSRSEYFKRGMEELRGFYYGSAANFFNEELKLHPRNGYALANKAYGEWQDAKKELNEFLIKILFAEYDTENKLELDTAMLQLQYEQKQEEMKRTITGQWLPMTDKALRFIPAADTETRCAILRELKSPLLEDADAPLEVRTRCWEEIVKCDGADYDTYESLFGYYVDNGRVDDARRLYNELSKTVLDPSPFALLLANHECDDHNYERALDIINGQVLNIDPENVEGLKMRTSINDILGNYAQSLNDVLTLCDNVLIDDAYTPLFRIGIISQAATQAVMDSVASRSRQFLAKSPSELEEYNGFYWPMVESMLNYNLTGDYAAMLRNMEQTGQSIEEFSSTRIADAALAHYALGRVDDALFLLDVAQQRANEEYAPSEDDETQSGDGLLNTPLRQKIGLEMTAGMTDRVLHDAQVLTLVARGDNDLNRAQYATGWSHFARKDYDKALEAYSQWLETDPENLDARYWHARTLLALGETEQGKRELQELLDADDYAFNQEFRMNLLYFLDRTAEARDILYTLERNTETERNMTVRQEFESDTILETMSAYNLACAFALHNEPEKAHRYLKRHYEEIPGTGSDAGDAANYGWMELDSDLDGIRDLPEFKSLVEEHRNRWLRGEYRTTRFYPQP